MCIRDRAEIVPPRPDLPVSLATSMGDVEPDPHAPLTQKELWEAVAAALTGNDVILADQGTSYCGIAAQRLPSGAVFIGQPLWASIGYTLPAMIGAAIAAPHRRPVLLIGDGAAQLTVAELGTLIRQRIPAVIIVVNNNGYTVELSLIHISEPTRPAA